MASDMNKQQNTEIRQPWELAWSAAFIEGEGTITISVSPPNAKCGSVSTRYVPWVKADNTEPEPIYRLQSFFNGNVRAYTPSKGKKKAYHWMITGPQAIECLNAVKSYFASPKRIKLTELIFELNERIQNYPRGGGVRLSAEEIQARNNIVAKVRILNNRSLIIRPKGTWNKARAELNKDRLPGI